MSPLKFLKILFFNFQGPTVASAPSVEHEDYRTPKPSVVSPMGGKSFDFGEREGPAGVNFSDSNGLIKAS